MLCGTRAQHATRMGEHAEGAFCNNHYSQMNNVGYEHLCGAVKRMTDDYKVICLRGFVMRTLYSTRQLLNPSHKVKPITRYKYRFLRMSSALELQFIETLSFKAI